MKKQIRQWCKTAIKKRLTIKEAMERLKDYPLEIQKYAEQILIELKGGNIEMPRKKEKDFEFPEDEEDEEEFLEDTDEEEGEEEEEESELVKPKRVKKKIPKTSKIKGWQFFQVPARFGYYNPLTKKVIVEASSVEELQIQLQAIIAQNSMEAAENTR